MNSLSPAVCILLVLQSFHMAGQFAIIPPPSPVLGFLGKDIILPCQITTSNVAEGSRFTVQWAFDISSGKIDVKFYDQRKKIEIQDKRYENRTELFHSELSKGNVSLHLKNIQLSDQGQYTCMVYYKDWYDQAVVELNMMAIGKEPSISLDHYKGSGIGLTCNSEGWYPKPQTVWLDHRGENRSEKPDTTITQTPAGTFSISSSMTIQPGADSEISCKIINSVLPLESESRILISDVFYPTTSAWLPPFIVILLLILGSLLFAVLKLRKSNRNLSKSESKKNAINEEQENLKQVLDSVISTRQACVKELQIRSDRVSEELDYRRARSFAAPVTLDPNFKHSKCNISKDKQGANCNTQMSGKEMPLSGIIVMVSKEAYASGKHYWEVKVTDRVNWELGVLTKAQRDKGNTEKFEETLGEQRCSLRSAGEYFFSNHNEIKKKDVSYSQIGIFLDQEEKKITFYNANLMFLITSIPIQLTGELYPFLSFEKADAIDKEKPLEIVHIGIPIPCEKA